MRRFGWKQNLAGALVAVLATVGLAGCGSLTQQQPSAPVASPSTSEAPKAEAPRVETPKAEAPKVQAPPQPAAPKELTRASVAVPAKSLNFLVFFLGKEKGVFAAEGVDLDIQTVAANTAIAAVLNGDIDITAAGSSAQRAALQGSPIRLIMTVVGAPTTGMYARKDIPDIKSLKGKNIGITSVAGTPAVTIRAMLRAHGLDPEKDVQLVATTTTDNVWLALKSGSVDAGLLSPPFDAMAENASFRMLAWGGDFVKGTQSGIGASVKNMQTNPDKMKRVIRGILKSIAWTLDHEAEAVEYIAKTWNLSPEDARGTYRTMARVFLRDGMPSTEALLSDLEDKVSAQDLQKTVDFSLLKQVLSDLGIKQ